MRIRSALKLLVVAMAATAVVYGVSLVIGKFIPASGDHAAPSAATSRSDVAASAPAPSAVPEKSAAQTGSQANPDNSYAAAARKAVQRLEDGDAAQSLVEIRAAIDAAKAQGAEPTEVDALRNMLMRIQYCLAGPEGMLAWMSEPEAALTVADPCLPAALDRARLEVEALLALGKLQEAWDKSKHMLACFDKPGPGVGKEPLALEQAIRIAATASATDQIPELEKRLRGAVDAGITLKTLVDPQLPLATLGTLAKIRGDCLTAIKLYDQALDGFDTNMWLREKRIAPWRLQILALVAMDRVDCLRQAGEIERAKGRSAALAADLATALGEQDPLVLQAADQRDQMMFAPTSP